MNRKRAAVLLCLVIAILVIFPFIIELLYDLGEKYPIIITNYEQSDVLSYAATSIGLIISLIALYLSLDATVPKFTVCHALTENEEGIAVYIELYNDSQNGYEIQGLDLCSKGKQLRRTSISMCQPFFLEAKSYKEFVISTKRMKEHLQFVSKTGAATDAVYEVNLSIGRRIYIKTGDLAQYLEL